MTENFYNELKSDFKQKDIEKIKEKVFQLLSEFSNGYLREKLRIHPLGFFFCRLHEFSNKETIRIHVWLDKHTIQKPLMDIHNHFYNISSFIITGTVSNTLFKVLKTEPYTHSVYIGSYRENEKRVLTNQKDYYKLEEGETQIINEGELYEIKKSEVHKGDTINNTLSISLVYTEEPSNPTPLVFGPIKELNEYEYSSHIVNVNKIIDLEKKIKCLSMAKKS
ncbi:MAG: hypothetical protein ACJAT9_000353 [Polaribacter sp.]|jgi:hypothetical protein